MAVLATAPTVETNINGGEVYFGEDFVHHSSQTDKDVSTKNTSAFKCKAGTFALGGV